MTPEDQLRAAMREAGAKVFGGNWIDHSVDCQFGIEDKKCSCGLTDWIRRNEDFLGVKLGGGVRVSAGASHAESK